MADHVPFVNSGNDLKRLRDYYDTPRVARIQLGNAASLSRRRIQHTCDLWMDPEIDGYHRLLKDGQAWPEWEEHIRQFNNSEILADPDSVNKPNAERVRVLVYDILDKCQRFKPAWITVPQLPVIGGSTRNKMNAELAKASASWKAERGFQGKYVLPLIFTHQNQLKGKTQWAAKLKVAQRCFDAAGANIVWAVDSDLADWRGSDKFRDRFAALVRFHTDLRERFSGAKIIAGPYWGMNLVLWARDLCDHPAISLGHGFSYRISGGFIPPEPPKAMVALTPLRRLADHTDELKTWLDSVLNELHHSDEAARQFSRLRHGFAELASYDIARNQVAEFYGSWLRQLNSIPPSGRSLFLFQDLSSAFVLGRKLVKELGTSTARLPKSEAPARDPNKVAEQLMLHCL
ncbi:MAG: hypothetical protein JW993_02075 [Sedimentisphaerales bacterium]|nr:hypothetical protein [Sedimentisphaerales bacterium]